MKKHIFLTGFMGTGKSTVGRILAKKTLREFVDTDLIVESKMGMSISNIFIKYGEKRFREEETKVIYKLVERENNLLVIALGGGALLQKANRQIILNNDIATTVNLKAEAQEIYRRLITQKDRPLLREKDLYSTIKKLLKERKKLYDAVPFQIQTDKLTPEEVAESIYSIIFPE